MSLVQRRLELWLFDIAHQKFSLGLSSQAVDPPFWERFTGGDDRRGGAIAATAPQLHDNLEIKTLLPVVTTIRRAGEDVGTVRAARPGS